MSVVVMNDDGMSCYNRWTGNACMLQSSHYLRVQKFPLCRCFLWKQPLYRKLGWSLLRSPCQRTSSVLRGSSCLGITYWWVCYLPCILTTEGGRGRWVMRARAILLLDYYAQETHRNQNVTWYSPTMDSKLGETAQSLPSIVCSRRHLDGTHSNTMQVVWMMRSRHNCACNASHLIRSRSSVVASSFHIPSLEQMIHTAAALRAVALMESVSPLGAVPPANVHTHY